MVRPDIVTLVNAEAQTSDTAVYKVDMPKAGGISAIDMEFKFKNYASTGYQNKDLLDAINRIELVFNGTDRRFSMTGQEAFRMHWMKFGEPLQYNWDETLGTVWPSVKFRIMPGRYIGDPQYGIDLGKFNNVQLNVDYDLTEFGTAGTNFTTATFTPTILLHMFQAGSVPSFRGMIGQREIYSVTTTGSDINRDITLPSQYPISGIAVFSILDNVNDYDYISDIIIGKDQYRTRWVDGSWEHLAPICNENLNIREERYKLVVANAEYIDTHLTNIQKQQIHAAGTAWVSTSVDGLYQIFGNNDPSGNRCTFVMTQLDGANTGGAVTMSAAADEEVFFSALGDVDGILYFPFGSPDDQFADALKTTDLASAQVRLVDDASGAFAAVVVEEIYS